MKHEYFTVLHFLALKSETDFIVFSFAHKQQNKLIHIKVYRFLITKEIMGFLIQL